MEKLSTLQQRMNSLYKTDLEFTKNQFFQTHKHLFELSKTAGESLVRRSQEELERYYGHTLFMFLGDRLIGKSCIHPTDKMDNIVEIEDTTYHIGETTGTLIIPEHRNQGLGTELGIQALNILGTKYDMIIGGTINEIMKNIRLKEGFQVTPFPPKLFEEGKNYFKDKLPGGENEFTKKAVCIVKFKDTISSNIRHKLLHLFQEANG